MSVHERSAPTADGVELAVTESGVGQPLLLIPGLGATRRIFDQLTPSLDPRYRIIRFDPRGVGDSPPGSLPLTMTQLARDAAAVLNAVGVERAHVFGASMGGAVAQHLVVDSPDRVTKLVLAATQPPAPQAVPPDSRAREALLGKGARTPADAYRKACTVLYSVAFQRTHAAFIEEQIRIRAAHPIPARVFTAQYAALRAPTDLWERLGAVRTETLVLHGTLDAIAPFENAKLLVARIPGARGRWFNDCGHLFFHERPQESARVMHEFLRD